MEIKEKLQQQVDIRGTASPFGLMAKEALDEINNIAQANKQLGEENKNLKRTLEKANLLIDTLYESGQLKADMEERVQDHFQNEY